MTMNDFSFVLKLLLDILIVWTFIYALLKIVKNNARTIQLVKGALVVLAIKWIAALVDLTAVSYIIDIFLNWGVVVILVLFQPEIRGMLERVGNTTSMINSNLSKNERIEVIDEIVHVCSEMSNTKTGALISIERAQSLTDYVATGTKMDSRVSKELIGTIFQYGTPLHDGAVIIQGNRIACAAAYFPPTTKDLPSRYGARHRAAVGISEITDSITIIVSEETGKISVAYKGNLKQYTSQELEDFLTSLLVEEKVVVEPQNIITPAINSVINLARPKKFEGDVRVKAIKIVDKYSTRQGAK